MNSALPVYKSRFVIPQKSDCYANAFHLLEELYRKGYVLVHGNPRLVTTGKRYGHAWLENDKLVIDGTAFCIVPKDAYYTAGEITYTRKYDFETARKLACEHETYGAWDPEFDALAYLEERKNSHD